MKIIPDSKIKQIEKKEENSDILICGKQKSNEFKCLIIIQWMEMKFN